MDVVRMPQLGETVTEGTITTWSKAVGDRVEVDDVLFEVSTDKIDTDVPSADAGFLRAITVAEGVTVPIGTVVAILTATPDERFEVPAEHPAGQPAAPPPVVPSATPMTRPVPVAAAARPSSASTSPGFGGDGFLSPAVRRLLDEHGLTAADVAGSGDGGRITRADVLAAAAYRARFGPPGALSRLAPAAATDDVVPPAVAGPDDDVVELTRARRNTARNMARSARTAVHTLVGTQVDYAAIDAVRRPARLSYLPFVARAVVDALARFPHLNASFGTDELIVHRRVNLGVAVDVDGQALVVPVVHDADGLRLRPLSDAVADLATRARTKRLTVDDLAGGTFTITNVGAYGTTVTAPIINQPEVAILSTDGVRMTPVAVPDGNGGWAVVVHPVGSLSLTFDHRAVDGAYAAAFLAAVRDTLETRPWAEELS